MAALYALYNFQYVFSAKPLLDRCRNIADFGAALGLIGFAFKRQFGPVRFWGFYAVFYGLFTCFVWTNAFARAAKAHMFSEWGSMAFSVGLVTVLTTSWCIALLRYGGVMRQRTVVPSLANVFA